MRRRVVLGLAGFGLLGASLWAYWPSLRGQTQRVLRSGRDIVEIRARVTPMMAAAFERQGLTWGAPVFLRIFKEEAVLELWVENGARYELFKTYPICAYSGDLGPKLKEGDRQAPEGFYEVGLRALNPQSSYHLSFNLGFPNAYDRSHGRTGSFLMVHGACVSIGCYAMTDPLIEEIYVTVEAALRTGQGAVPVHAFPFRMTEARMEAMRGHRWFEFWENVAEGYRAFEKDQRLPEVSAADGVYRFSV